MSQQIITANRLSDGLVVFRAADGTWSELFTQAARFDEDAIANALTDASAEVTRVVGAYAVPLADDTGLPARIRERIRLLGPSVRADLGKQAGEGQAVEPIARRA